MMQIFLLCLLLIYYWYFYYTSSFKRVDKPSKGSPLKPPTQAFEFTSIRSNHFRFVVDGKTVWEHTLPNDTSLTFRENKMVQIDSCHGTVNGTRIPARGKNLYEYLNNSTEIKGFFNFKEDGSFITRRGNVFYFKCFDGRIKNLEICPSGSTFLNNDCESINKCTAKNDGALLPHPDDSSQYILCYRGKEIIQQCPDETIFHHNRCESVRDLNHYCKVFPNKSSFLLNDETLVECRNGKPFYIKCEPGMKFFDNQYCEPANCFGLPDGSILPLPEQKIDLFKFVPGYMTCKNNKIQDTVECPQIWNDSLTEGDNLTSLPMVFDTKREKCTIPTFCENVFSDDPDVIVPVHEFTKHVANWNLSHLFDRSVGFTCGDITNRKRKKRVLPPGMLISKRFKAEPACEPLKLLPMYGNLDSFYDCDSKSVVSCPDSTFFNGSTCIQKPTDDVFEYRGLPLFKFDSLNFESWIKPWEYSKDPIPSCKNVAKSKYIEMYNICSHPDCVNYAFLSQIPNMSILLPREHRAKCKFYENEKLLKKEPVDFEYQFWNQKIMDGGDSYEEEPCIPGQKLKTGNFIWDSTLFATCNIDQPFVFCPSKHSQHIMPIINSPYFACEPPTAKSYIFNQADWTSFETNEIKRILRVNENIEPQYIRRNKSKFVEYLPKEGLDISEGERLNLLVSQPVKLEPRYRVTHPPNVVFEQEDLSIIDDVPNVIAHTSTLDRGFLVKLKNFTNRRLSFPKYKSIHFVESFDPFSNT